MNFFHVRNIEGQNSSEHTVIIHLVLNPCFLGASLSGYNMNQIELSPNYAGTLRGASSTVANICGFATPAVVGALTKGQVKLFLVED